MTKLSTHGRVTAEAAAFAGAAGFAAVLLRLVVDETHTNPFLAYDAPRGHLKAGSRYKQHRAFGIGVELDLCAESVLEPLQGPVATAVNLGAIVSYKKRFGNSHPLFGVFFRVTLGVPHPDNP